MSEAVACPVDTCSTEKSPMWRIMSKSTAMRVISGRYYDGTIATSFVEPLTSTGANNSKR